MQNTQELIDAVKESLKNEIDTLIETKLNAFFNSDNFKADVDSLIAEGLNSKVQHMLSDKVALEVFAASMLNTFGSGLAASNQMRKIAEANRIIILDEPFQPAILAEVTAVEGDEVTYNFQNIDTKGEVSTLGANKAVTDRFTQELKDNRPEAKVGDKFYLVAKSAYDAFKDVGKLEEEVH